MVSKRRLKILLQLVFRKIFSVTLGNGNPEPWIDTGYPGTSGLIQLIQRWYLYNKSLYEIKCIASATRLHNRNENTITRPININSSNPIEWLMKNVRRFVSEDEDLVFRITISRYLLGYLLNT